MHEDHYADVARRAAEDAVWVLHPNESRGSSRAWLEGTQLHDLLDGPPDYAEGVAAQARDVLSLRFLAAIREALALPLPGGAPQTVASLRTIMSERGGGLYSAMKGLSGRAEKEWLDSFAGRLLAHVDHLERLLHDAESGALSAWAESYKAAFRAGAEAQRVECVEAVLEDCEDAEPRPLYRRLARLVQDVPTVMPEDDARSRVKRGH